jgi:arylsulfatase
MFVFVTSDNGAEEDVMAGGIFVSDAGHQPWRGAKGTTWEGGIRVSAIAY